METEILVTVNNYSGPLDLLLELVEKRKVTISDIDILDLINDYLSELDKLEDNFSSKIDFVLITSELLEIKALELIKSEERESKAKEFKRRLEEYKMIKELQDEIATLQKEKNISYTKKESRKIIRKSREYNLKSLKQIDLLSHYQKYLESLNEEEYLQLNIEKNYSLEDERDRIYVLLLKDSLTIDEVFSRAKSRSHLIYMFLGILEMYKEGLIDIEDDTLTLIKK